MQPNPKSAKNAFCLFFFEKFKNDDATKCKLSEFQQFDHITVNDAIRPYSSTLHPNRKKWTKTQTWQNYQFKD